MAVLDSPALYHLLVDVEAPMDDILASLPFVLPALILGIMLLFYQKHLPRTDMKRNLIVFLCIASFVGSFLVLLYAGFGSRWYGPTGLPFGSWPFFTTALQALMDVVFGSVVISLLYVTGIFVLFFVLVQNIISPPEPDVVSLREELNLARDTSRVLEEKIQKMEAENKRLSEFLSEREKALTDLEGELESIKAEIQEREASIAMMEEELGAKVGAVAAVPDAGLQQQLAVRDQTIEALTQQIEALRVSEGGAVAPEVQAGLDDLKMRWEDLSRRAETASEVSENVVSDLVDLISQVEASKKDESTKRALVSLIEALGRSMTRVSRNAGETAEGEPPVMAIGAIIMVNETVDAIKKIIRN